LSTTATAPKLNKFERFKAEKDGLAVKDQLSHFAQIGWEAMDETDLGHRLKWVGLFFRPVTPGKFMLRMRMPNGVLTSGQMRVLAQIVERYGEDGNADITTRQNLQLRGVRLEDIPEIFLKLEQAGLTSMQSGMDNVRNITGSPVAGLDADELIDTRGLVRKVQDMITNNGKGNASFTNLPRKFNIAIAGCRDNSIHAEINDIAFVPAYKEGKLGFNVLVGGFFSAKRCAAAIPLNAWVDPRDVVALCEAILVVYRDNGSRENRHQSRLMWLIDEWGLEKFRSAVEQHLGYALQTAAPKDEIMWDKRDHIGIHAQQQPGLNYVGLHVPVGRLYANEMFELARMAEVYGGGEVRLTVEQNVIIPNIPDSRLGAFLREPLLQVFSIEPHPLSRALVSCTGSQFCKFALVETKNRAVALMNELDQELEVSKPVRMHWTGCPNSCGQPQVADIGFMGTKVRKDGKTVEGVDIYMGGKVGKDAELGECVQKGVACEDLKPLLRKLLIENFGAQPRSTPLEEVSTARLERDRAVQGLAMTNGKFPTAGVDLGPAPFTSAPGMPVPTVEPERSVQPAIVAFLRSGKEATGDQSQSILEIAQAAGLELDSSCQSGSCGTCKQKLLEGDIGYEGDPEGLEADEREAGMILTCIAHPVGRVVVDA
jgi:ferredoxin-nitrite reductase